jgi:hypothetical protein
MNKIRDGKGDITDINENSENYQYILKMYFNKLETLDTYGLPKSEPRGIQTT